MTILVHVQVVAGNRAPNDSESRGFRIVGADVVPGGEPVAKAVFIDGPGKDVDELLNEDIQKNGATTKTRQAAMLMLTSSKPTTKPAAKV